MNRIVINEVDSTTDTNVVESRDIVYIPGFSNNSNLDPLTPTLCRTLSEFESLIGSEAPYFTGNQYYPVASASAPGFAARAIPEAATGQSQTVMFAANTIDPSYVMAKELVSMGIPVLYEKCNGVEIGSTDDEEETTTTDISVTSMYRVLSSRIFTTSKSDDVYVSNLLAYDYDFKYLTSGGYPIYEYGLTTVSSGSPYQALTVPAAAIAQMRGDCLLLLDHTDNPARALVGSDSVFNIVNTNKLSETVDTFAAMFTPYAEYSLGGSYANSTQASAAPSNILPGSFAYLASLAKSVKTNPNWLAISGVSRGYVPNLNSLHIDNLLSNSIADLFQPTVTGATGEKTVCINAITKIDGDYCIWGNRTLQDQGLNRSGFATKFVNQRNILCEIKKTLHSAALKLMFEPNNDILWANFKANVTPLLDSMKSGSGISGYKIIKASSSSKIKLSAVVKIYPLYSVEAFEISVAITDSDVTVE